MKNRPAYGSVIHPVASSSNCQMSCRVRMLSHQVWENIPRFEVISPHFRRNPQKRWHNHQSPIKTKYAFRVSVCTPPLFHFAVTTFSLVPNLTTNHVASIFPSRTTRGRMRSDKNFRPFGTPLLHLDGTGGDGNLALAAAISCRTTTRIMKYSLHAFD